MSIEYKNSKFTIFHFRGAEDRAHFVRLNRAWIEKYFEIEPHDIAVFESPESYILEPGGFILLAALEGAGVVGAVAGVLREPGMFELAKLGVDPAAQGLGIGRALCEQVIEECRLRGAQRVLITTNSKLAAAVAIYEKMGFMPADPKYHVAYKRCDLSLMLELGNPSLASANRVFNSRG